MTAQERYRFFDLTRNHLRRPLTAGRVRSRRRLSWDGHGQHGDGVLFNSPASSRRLRPRLETLSGNRRGLLVSYFANVLRGGTPQVRTQTASIGGTLIDAFAPIAIRVLRAGGLALFIRETATIMAFVRPSWRARGVLRKREVRGGTRPRLAADGWYRTS